MLILSVKVPKRKHADGDDYERVVLEFSDGTQGVIHFFERVGDRMKCGLEMPDTVSIRRASILDDVPPEKLTAFAEGLSKLADACRPMTSEELNAGFGGGPSA
jgi:sRNA-binding carbon storage regulator CsrA